MDEVEELIKQLKDTNPDVSWKAVDRLIEMGDVKAVEPLIDLILSDEEKWDVRRRAARVLNKLKDAEIMPKLMAYLTDEHRFIRDMTLRTLTALAPEFGIDLSIVGSALRDFLERVREKGIEHDTSKAREWAVEAYMTLAYSSVVRAKKDADLNEIRTFLQKMMEEEKEPERRGRMKQHAASVYVQIAKAVSERKKKEMPGEMLEGRIKPQKKPGVYRVRRVVNG